jgi:hypothetical protein
MPDQPHVERLADLQRQIEACVYLLTRPISEQERAHFQHLLEELARRVRELQERARERLEDQGAE